MAAGAFVAFLRGPGGVCLVTLNFLRGVAGGGLLWDWAFRWALLSSVSFGCGAPDFPRRTKEAFLRLVFERISENRAKFDRVQLRLGPPRIPGLDAP